MAPEKEEEEEEEEGEEEGGEVSFTQRGKAEDVAQQQALMVVLIVIGTGMAALLTDLKTYYEKTSGATSSPRQFLIDGSSVFLPLVVDAIAPKRKTNNRRQGQGQGQACPEDSTGRNCTTKVKKKWTLGDGHLIIHHIPILGRGISSSREELQTSEAEVPLEDPETEQDLEEGPKEGMKVEEQVFRHLL
ncbi:uncharacterized protein LOC143034920 [Oratosquilla oratoria]|uniref:uncharacterized protein LOC143034920 n=1 Tax=Oratosquilla oratoria TaxID=337810 RepID=UPI003F765791